jgi:hypothetical protein
MPGGSTAAKTEATSAPKPIPARVAAICQWAGRRTRRRRRLANRTEVTARAAAGQAPQRRKAGMRTSGRRLVGQTSPGKRMGSGARAIPATASAARTRGSQPGATGWNASSTRPAAPRASGPNGGLNGSRTCRPSCTLVAPRRSLCTCELLPGWGACTPCLMRSLPTSTSPFGRTTG